MKLLLLDTFSGASGDMFLGLLIDLGLDPALLEAELSKLPVDGWRLDIRRERRQGIEGTRVEVVTGEDHHHRTWAMIDRMLAESPLAPEAAALARRIFLRLGLAEAKVHGVAIEQVHFHEVGALDSIIDIAGAAIGLTRLAPERIFCSPLPLNRGLVETAHGNYPLPAPATLEVLRGCPLVDDPCRRELVTPTGAAIIAEIASFSPPPPFTVDATGYGVGGWDLADRPNLLRGVLGESPTGRLDQDRVTVLETHLDDASPEWLGALMEDLLAGGALDAGFTPLQMKKNRPGVRVTVIAPAGSGPALARLILRQTSAIGVRSYETDRFKLAREEITIETPLGQARVKLLRDGEALVRITPEFESCRQLSLESGRPLPDVYRTVERAADRWREGQKG